MPASRLTMAPPPALPPSLSSFLPSVRPSVLPPAPLPLPLSPCPSPPAPRACVSLACVFRSRVSCQVYVGYMAVVSMTFFLITGALGFVSCFIFVRQIYSAIKID